MGIEELICSNLAIENLPSKCYTDIGINFMNLAPSYGLSSFALKHNTVPQFVANFTNGYEMISQAMKDYHNICVNAVNICNVFAFKPMGINNTVVLTHFTNMSVEHQQILKETSDFGYNAHFNYYQIIRLSLLEFKQAILESSVGDSFSFTEKHMALRRIDDLSQLLESHKTDGKAVGDKGNN